MANVMDTCTQHCFESPHIFLISAHGKCHVHNTALKVHKNVNSSKWQLSWMHVHNTALKVCKNVNFSKWQLSWIQVHNNALKVCKNVNFSKWQLSWMHTYIHNTTLKVHKNVNSAHGKCHVHCFKSLQKLKPCLPISANSSPMTLNREFTWTIVSANLSLPA